MIEKINLNVTSNNINKNLDKAKSGINTINNKIVNTIDTVFSVVDTKIEEHLEKINSENIYNEQMNKLARAGGNQENLCTSFEYWSQDKTVKDIVKKYYSNVDQEDLELLFFRMSTCGCGYIAAINTLMDKYSSNPEEFKEKFGFDFSQIGKTYIDNELVEYNYVNYEYAFLDFFLYYNKNFRGYDTIEKVYGNAIEEQKYYSGDAALDEDDFLIEGADGVYSDDVGIVFSQYLSDKGINLQTFDKERLLISNASYFGKTEEEMKKELYSWKGETGENYGGKLNYFLLSLIDASDSYVTVSAYDFNLYSLNDADGNGKLDDIVYENVGGHGMTYVARTEDPAKIIVSSWGNKYVIDIDCLDDYTVYSYNN